MTEVISTVKSAYLQNERLIWIRQPSAGSSAKALTIFLDAELYRDRVGAPSVIDSLEGQIASSWFVFVSMASIEARWLECPCYPPFAKFIAEELLFWLEDRYPEMKAIRQRVLVGLSYTGLAAAFVAKQYPRIFQRVVSQSGSFWWSDCWLTEQFRASPQISTEFYLDVGTREVHENVRHREDVLQVVSQIEGVRRFRDVLCSTGHSVTYAEFEGGHDFAAWKHALPGALQWALPSQAPTAPSGRGSS